MGSNQASATNDCPKIPSLVVENFRQAAGIQNVYRSASPDGLSDMDFSRPGQWAESDRFVFEQIQLFLDLRSSMEVDSLKSRAWLSAASPAGFQVIDSDDYESLHESNSGQRLVVRFHMLSPPNIFPYVEQKLLNADEKRKAARYRKLQDDKEISKLCIEEMNRRGLIGLNELILETGKGELLRALKIIATHLEQKRNDNIIVHCAQGKDRTGMLVMLLQSILGLSDKEIIEDYFLSDRMLLTRGSAAADAALGNRKQGALDWDIFSRATREAMVATLALVRQNYGSVSPGYLDHIGFDHSWRQRILAVLKPSPCSDNRNTSKM